MDASGYTTLTRQGGLMREMQAIANNIANSATTGFRREGVIFSEYVSRLDGAPSLSMARASARNIDLSQGGLSMTGGQFDFAIQGEGFFQIAQPDGTIAYSRDGGFKLSSTGQLVTANGAPLQPAITIPPNVSSISIGQDGTVSVETAAGGGAQVLGQIQIARFANPHLKHSVHQIATDSSQKIPQRWPPSVLGQIAKGASVEHHALAAAVFVRYTLGVDDKGQAYALNDPQADSLKALGAAQRTTPEACVRALLAREDLWGNALPQHAAWIARVTHWHQQVMQHGLDAAIQQLLTQEA